MSCPNSASDEARRAAIKAEADRLEYEVANFHRNAASTFTRMRELLNQALAIGAEAPQGADR